MNKAPWWAWSLRFEREFQDTLDRIGNRRPSYEPRATGHVPEMIELMELLIRRGHAYADGQGEERAAPMDETIEVGLFTAKPGEGAFDRSNVLYLERRPIKSGRQTFRILTRQRPTHVGIDPYNKFIDRNSDDNLTEVT